MPSTEPGCRPQTSILATQLAYGQFLVYELLIKIDVRGGVPNLKPAIAKSLKKTLLTIAGSTIVLELVVVLVFAIGNRYPTVSHYASSNCLPCRSAEQGKSHASTCGLEILYFYF
jgi:hypothetical protein